MFPRGVVFEHGVEDDQELSDACDLDGFEGFSGAGESGGEFFDDGIASSSGERGHVQDGAEFFSTTPDGTFSTDSAAVAGVRRDASEGSDLLAIEFSEFGQFGDECGASDRPDAGGALDDLELGSPVVVALEQFGDAAFDGVRLAFDGLEHLANGFRDEFIGRLLEPAFFRRMLFDELPTAGQQRVEETLFFGDFCLGSGLHALGELGQDGRVEPVGLGVLAEGLGEVASLPRIDQGDRQVGILDRQEGRSFVPSGRFDEDQTGRQ